MLKNGTLDRDRYLQGYREEEEEEDEGQETEKEISAEAKKRAKKAIVCGYWKHYMPTTQIKEFIIEHCNGAKYDPELVQVIVAPINS